MGASPTAAILLLHGHDQCVLGTGKADSHIVPQDRRVLVSRGDNIVLEAPLKTAESVAKGNLTQRAFDAATELVVGAFRAGASRL